MATRTSQIVIRARDHASKTFGRVGKSSGALKQRLLSLKTAVAAGFAVAVAAATAAAVKGVRDFGRLGDQLGKMSKRTGVAVESLSELSFVASQTGTSMEAMETGIRRMQRSIYDASRGLATQTDVLADLGVRYEELEGLNPEDQFMKLMGALGEVEDASKRAALAQAFFGRAGTQLLPMAQQGAAGIAELRDRARELGLVMSGEDAAAAERFTDTMDELKRSVKMVSVNIGAALAPAIGKVAAFFTEKAVAIQQTARNVIGGAIDFIRSLWADFSVGFQAQTQVLSEMLGAFGVHFGGVGDTVGTVISGMKKAYRGMVTGWVAGMTFLEVVIVNWKDSLRLALNAVALGVVKLVLDVKHWFTVVIPDLLHWFGRNWVQVFIDLKNATKAVFVNMWSNIKSFVDAVWAYMKGEGWDWQWTGLLKGFEATLQEMPKIAKRELTDLEKQLGANANELAGKLGGEFRRKLAERMSQFETDAAAAGGERGAKAPKADITVNVPTPAAMTAATTTRAGVQAVESRLLTMQARSKQYAERTEKNTGETVKQLREVKRATEEVAAAVRDLRNDDGGEGAGVAVVRL